MAQTHITWIEGSIVEHDVHMTMVELAQASQTPEDLIMAWVSEGVLSPAGASPEDWRFSGDSLRRAKTAARLMRDLELNSPGVALALDLLDEITQLRQQLQLQNPHRD
ncbi:chaperone modulator CbpM [Polynucleobacter sp.]|jgi:chaperone modulatory protein CbpM|uniref:chaperone modulator CbpM n=1 Tax=Polynucleobacter sp. TaxID=2029855 RepID=UPI002733CC22|nr:chaperone modulator CbpM [Polynucleobacter sp.]MDP3121353.1 chaperone modulator CbpM [Polynucleobacter sp.]